MITFLAKVGSKFFSVHVVGILFWGRDINNCPWILSSLVERSAIYYIKCVFKLYDTIKSIHQWFLDIHVPLLVNVSHKRSIPHFASQFELGIFAVISAGSLLLYKMFDSLVCIHTQPVLLMHPMLDLRSLRSSCTCTVTTEQFPPSKRAKRNQTGAKPRDPSMICEGE